MVDKRVLALGFFDGVHLGHIALLQAAKKQADKIGATVSVLTFDVHPDEVIYGRPLSLLTSREDQKKLLLSFGADEVLYLHFDRAMMQMPYVRFFHELLLDRYHATYIVCGHDFHFGSRGEGTAEKLQELCQENRIGCEIVSAVRFAGEIVSSTHIRDLLQQGELAQANNLLGHAHFMTGEVVNGRHFGRTLGVPTANLHFASGVLEPKHGVYACLVCFDGSEYRAVCNIGRRPTVGGKSVTVEPWLLDYSGDLYGKTLEIHFCAFLRPEQKFENIDELKQQIMLDRQTACRFFREYDG